MDHQRLHVPESVPRRRRSLRETMRDHARLTLLVGFVLLLAGAILPWMRVWLPYQGYVDVSGFERAGDAGLLVEFGLAGLALTWSEGAWHSRVTVLVAGPLTLALMGVLLLRVAHGDANIYLASLKQQGGTGSISPGFWTANVGAVVATIGGAVQLWRRRASLSFNVGLTRIAVAGSIGGVVGAIGGFLAGTEIAGRITTGAIVAVSSSVVVVLALLLAFVGCWIGAVGAARLARSLPRR